MTATNQIRVVIHFESDRKDSVSKLVDGSKSLKKIRKEILKAYYGVMYISFI
ncbi:hypothetical protein HOR70_gp25 [Pectobacterium phage PPWS4]|uniref:Uncharacterized protein n=1 Tax=Pectobacterium phage PPWS4 TaxID=1961914 RepID=A0A250KAC3_9CAUD|nr:hypothetical protein HOR70_gp25 [Pectobacterium phage PPWS4]BBA26440.1 hypothetical protein [Pectobacterium phage PPWS4]